MRLTVTTWNINSVRLRIEQVGRFLADVQPDVLCLQETKCPDDRFPLEGASQAFGYPHVVHAGQKGYNGVAILSRFPFADADGAGLLRAAATPATSRVTLGPEAGAARRHRHP